MKIDNVTFIESLKFENASFGYNPENPLFKQVTFALPMKRNCLITGPAGNGQSTFLKLLAVLTQPQVGSLLINGADTTQMSFEEFLPFRRRISYTFDLGGLFANRTLLDNLTLPLLYHNTCTREEAEERAKAVADEFGFLRYIMERPASVSGGLRKTVCILRSFIQEPEMMVMDDPFTGVDAESARKIIRLMQERRESGQLKHVFFTSRDETWPERLGYDAIVIENGQPRFHEGAWKVAG